MKKETPPTAMILDPLQSLNLAKTIADLMGKLYSVQKEQSNIEIKATLDEVIDELRILKKTADQLEDENRELREKLRFNSDEFEFRNPYWYEKAHPNQPLCPKCFADRVRGQMSEKYSMGTRIDRMCLVCSKAITEGKTQDTNIYGHPPTGGVWS